VIIEESQNWLLQIDKKKVEVNFQDYYFVSTSQIDVYKIVTAFEPQSMYGLVNYGNFEYLINNEKFKILRVE